MKSFSDLLEAAKTVYDFKDAIWEDSGVDCHRCGYEMKGLYVQNRLYLVTCPCEVVHVVSARNPKDAIRKVNLGRAGALNPHKVLAKLLERYGNLKDEKETQSTDRGKRLIEAEAKGVKDSIQIARRILLNEEETT